MLAIEFFASNGNYFGHGQLKSKLQKKEKVHQYINTLI